jgi:hypothetical protein
MPTRRFSVVYVAHTGRGTFVSAIGQFWQTVTPAQLKRILVALLALALVPIAAALMTQEGSGAGRGGGEWQSPSSIFAARSPGQRNDGLVFWVKKRLAGLAEPRARPCARACSAGDPCTPARQSALPA